MIVSVRKLAPVRMFSVRAFNDKPSLTEAKVPAERKFSYFESLQKMLEHQVDLMIRMSS